MRMQGVNGNEMSKAQASNMDQASRNMAQLNQQ